MLTSSIVVGVGSRIGSVGVGRYREAVVRVRVSVRSASVRRWTADRRSPPLLREHASALGGVMMAADINTCDDVPMCKCGLDRWSIEELPCYLDSWTGTDNGLTRLNHQLSTHSTDD